MTRAEHLAWCKERALEYLPHNPHEAISSMLSDMTKHKETEKHIGLELGLRMIMVGGLKHPEEVRNFINGFN